MLVSDHMLRLLPSRRRRTFAVRAAGALLASVMAAQPAVAATRQDVPRDIRPMLREADRLLDAGRHEQARKLLEPLSQEIGPVAAPLSSMYRLNFLLAQCYLHSKQYDRALPLATMCRDYLASAADADGNLVAERQDVALMLAAIHEGRDEWQPATRFLQEALELDGRRSQKPPAWRIEALKRWGLAGKYSGNTPQLEQATREIQDYVVRLHVRYDEREISVDDYDKAISAYARFLQEQNKLQEARDEWRRLLVIFETANDSPRQAEIWSEIARIHEAGGRIREQVAALERCVAFRSTEVDRLTRLRARNDQPLLLARFYLAQSQRMLGRALASHGEVDSSATALNESKIALQALLEAVNERRDKLASGASISRNQALERLASEESQFVDSLALATLQELRAVHDAVGQEQDRNSIAAAEYDLQLDEQIHDLQVRLYSDDDPRVYRAKLQLGDTAKRLGHFELAHPYLVAAYEYWQHNMPDQRQELAQIAELLAAVERELGWQSDKRDLQAWLGQARSRLVSAMPANSAQKEKLPAQALIKFDLSLGRLAFEMGDVDNALSYFESAQQTARRHGDQNGELHALEFQRALFTAILQYEQALEIQRAIDRVASSSQPNDNNARMASITARAGLHIASQEIDASEQVLDEAATMDPAAPLPRTFDQQRALTQFLRIRRTVGLEERLSPEMLENARDYWASLVEIASGEPSAELERARALYYLSRLKYLEWHDARQYWASVYTSPTLGRSASYDERRAKHEMRCVQYQQDVERYMSDAEAYAKTHSNEAPAAAPDPSLTELAKRESQLRIEYQALRRLGERLNDERRAKSLNQIQLAGRSARDLSQLIRESVNLADRSIELLRELSSGPNEGYDPNLHYLALSNHVEVVYAQLVTTNWDNSAESNAQKESRNLLDRAVSSLEAAAELSSHPTPTRLGAFAESRSFYRSFGDRPPAAVLRDRLESHARQRPEAARPDVLQRLRSIADHSAMIQE